MMQDGISLERTLKVGLGVHARVSVALIPVFQSALPAQAIIVATTTAH